MLLRLGEIIARNMLSWLKFLIKLLLLYLVGCLYYCINDARLHKHQISTIHCRNGDRTKTYIYIYILQLLIIQNIKDVSSLLFSVFGFNSQIQLLFRSNTLIQHYLRMHHIYVCTSANAAVTYNSPVLNFAQPCDTNTSVYTPLDSLRAHVPVKLHAKQ